MRTALLRTSLWLLAAAPIWAGPCIPDTLANYIALPPTGCTVAGVQLKAFSFNAIAFSNPGVVVPPNLVQVTPVISGSRLGLSFTSPFFSVTNADFVTYRLLYTADPTADIRGLEDILDVSSPVFPGITQIVTDGCLGFSFSPNCAGSTVTIQVFHNGISSQLTDGVSFAPQSVLGVRHTISLNANGQRADMNGFRSSEVVPEPATLWLAAVALALLASRRRGLAKTAFELRQVLFQRHP